MKMLRAYGDKPKYDAWAPNGLLPSLTVEEVNSAAALLPPPAQGQPQYRKVVMDLERLGRAMIAFKLSEAGHHKSSHMFWTACFARPI
jgi:hypothetical protein